MIQNHSDFCKKEFENTENGRELVKKTSFDDNCGNKEFKSKLCNLNLPLIMKADEQRRNQS